MKDMRESPNARDQTDSIPPTGTYAQYDVKKSGERRRNLSQRYFGRERRIQSR